MGKRVRGRAKAAAASSLAPANELQVAPGAVVLPNQLSQAHVRKMTRRLHFLENVKRSALAVRGRVSKQQKRGKPLQSLRNLVR